MQINFNMKAGETSDFFSFLYWMYNSEEYRSQLGEYGIKPNDEYEEFMIKLRKDVKLSEEKLKLYCGKDFSLSDVFISNTDIWNCLELDKCLNFIRQTDKDMLKFRLIRTLIRTERYGEDIEKIDEQSKIIASDNQKSLELIKSLEFDSSLKWELFCFLEEPEKYRDEYVSIMEEMIPIFYKHYEPKRKDIEKFSQYIKGKLVDNKIDFLKEANIGLFKDDIYEKLFISTSYISYYSLRSGILGNTNYVYIGLGFEDSIRQYRGEEENKLNKYINIYKNFSDPTRFRILKLLVEDKEYCNKDIAEELGITGATVSYHMDNLLTAELVTLDRKDRKNYYTVNKDVIMDGIEFLKRELNL